jgi:hypothetical protein
LVALVAGVLGALVSLVVSHDASHALSATRDRDVCLVGSGHHTGYWGDRELIAWLHGLLRAPEPRDPRNYVIEDATSAG